jgi:hypothetical protein
VSGIVIRKHICEGGQRFMGMINTIQERLRIPALLLAAFSLIAFAGCGTEAPGKSTITVAAFGDPIIIGPITNPSVTSTTTKTQNYRVSVADSTGLPLNDIDVNFLGQFTNGQSINFGGAIVSAPNSITVTRQTGDFGFLYFAITAPYYAVGVQLSFPMNQIPTPSATGGNLVEDTYFYQITSLDFAGETTAGGAISALVTSGTSTPTINGSVALSWKAVPGATSYNVYGGSALLFPGPPAIGYLVTIICPCPDPVTYTDIGQYFPQGPPPPAINTTGLGLNSVIGTAQATSGSALETFSIDF